MERLCLNEWVVRLAKRKSKSSRTKVVGASVGIIAVALVAVMFGVPLTQTLPAFDNEQLEIQFVEDEMIVEENQEIIEEIEDILINQDLFCVLSDETIRSVAECRLLTADEQFVPEDGLPVSEDCNGFNEVEIQECEEQINEKVGELYSQLMEVDPIDDQTEFSEQDPFEQLCEDNPDLLFCTNSPIQILTRLILRA